MYENFHDVYTFHSDHHHNSDTNYTLTAWARNPSDLNQPQGFAKLIVMLIYVEDWQHWPTTAVSLSTYSKPTYICIVSSRFTPLLVETKPNPVNWLSANKWPLIRGVGNSIATLNCHLFTLFDPLNDWVAYVWRCEKTNNTKCLFICLL